MNRLDRNYIPRFLVALFAIAMCAQSGCSTLGSLGLPFGNNPDKLLKTTDNFRKQVVRPAVWPSELSREVLASYILEPGDTVLIESTEFDSVARFPGDQTVMLDGMISLGKYGQVMAAGKTLEALQAEAQMMVEGLEETRWQQKRIQVEARLQQEADREKRLSNSDDEEDEVSEAAREDLLRMLDAEVPRPNVGLVSVRIVSLESKAFYVLGEVNSPGRFVLKGQETVLDAILEAGGLTDQANRHKIVLSRPSRPCDPRVVVPICYAHITQLGDTSTNYQIRPGDRIMVVSKTFVDDVWETICPDQYECCPACGPAQKRGSIPMLNCPSEGCVPASVEQSWDAFVEQAAAKETEGVRR